MNLSLENIPLFFAYAFKKKKKSHHNEGEYNLKLE